MFLSPSSPRRIASIVNGTQSPRLQRSANGQETQVLPDPISTFRSGTALQSTQTPPKLPLNLSSQPTTRHGTRITGVTIAATHHFLRRAKSVLRLGYHHIFPPQVGRLPQRNKTSGTDLDVTFILLVLYGTPLTTARLPRPSSFQTSPISGRPYLTAFRVPRQARGCWARQIKRKQEG